MSQIGDLIFVIRELHETSNLSKRKCSDLLLDIDSIFDLNIVGFDTKKSVEDSLREAHKILFGEDS